MKSSAQQNHFNFNVETRILRTVVVLCTAVLAVVAPAQDQRSSKDRVDPTRGVNAVYRLSGQPTGTYHEASIDDTEGISTSIESKLVFNRLGSKLEMTSRSRYRESSGGQLKSLTSDQSSSQQVTHLEVQAGDGSLAIKTTTGGKTYDHSVAFTDKLLGPEGARRLLVSRLHKPGDTVSYQTFSPEFAAVTTIGSTVVAVEDVAAGPVKIHALKVEQTMSSMPGKSTLWMDEQGWLVRQLISTPLGDIEALRTEGSQTDSATTQGASLPEETFSRSIVKANIRLPEERLVETVKLKIIHQRPELGWPDFSAQNQRVIEQTPNYVVLEVTRLDPNSATERAAAKDSAFTPYLAPNALLQTDDAQIEKIAKEVVGNEPDAWRAAQALQRWTNENMQFDPGIAIAPASEVARDRRGTCFGYSMLLGALTRAAGIPSRLRMGYVYAGGIWGGHAWIDVRIGDQWIPLDAALYSPGSADAARFSVFTSALEQGTLGGLGGIGQLFSNVDIKILQYTVAGRHVDVPENADSFTMNGDTYRNSWLGFFDSEAVCFQVHRFQPGVAADYGRRHGGAEGTELEGGESVSVASGQRSRCGENPGRQRHQRRARCGCGRRTKRDRRGVGRKRRRCRCRSRQRMGGDDVWASGKGIAGAGDFDGSVQLLIRQRTGVLTFCRRLRPSIFRRVRGVGRRSLRAWRRRRCLGIPRPTRWCGRSRWSWRRTS